MSAILFRAAHLVDGLSDEPREGVDVLVLDDRITEIGDPHLTTPRLPHLRVFDLGGMTLMPGLIDAHVHPSAAEVIEDYARPMPPSLRSQYTRIELEAMLRRGFTTARDAGGCDAGIRSAIERGLIDGPRLFVSGKALSQTGGHGDDRAVGDADPWPGAYPGEFARIADGVEEVRLAARQELRRGADQIKICASGGVMSETDPVEMTQYSEAEIAAVVEEAASRGTYVLAHAYGGEAIGRAVRCGVRSIEHANLIDRETAEHLAASGGFAVPTLATYDTLHRFGRELGFPEVSLEKLADVREAGLRSLEILQAASVPIGYGTDLLGPMHRHQTAEFRIRREAMPAFDIIRSATAVNAALLNREDELGVVASGARADLIALDGDPLADIALLDGDGSHLAMIIKDGAFYRRPS